MRSRTYESDDGDSRKDSETDRLRKKDSEAGSDGRSDWSRSRGWRKKVDLRGPGAEYPGERTERRRPSSRL